MSNENILRVELDTILEVFKEVTTHKKAYKDFIKEYNKINTVDMEIVLDSSRIEPDHTLPLYMGGFNGIEISKLRNVSRQLVMPKLSNQAKSTGIDMEDARKAHKENRIKLLELVAKYFVALTEETADLNTLDKVLNKQQKTNRSKYRAFTQLGGDPSVFTPEQIDKRMVNFEEDPAILDAFRLFEKDWLNRDIANKLDLSILEVQKYRRSYFRRRNNMTDLIGKEVDSKDWVGKK